MSKYSENFVLGFDIGTSSVKAALFGEAGNIIASSISSYEISAPQPGWAEQNPDDWWQAMITCTSRLLNDPVISAESIKAIGLTAQMCGCVPVDKNGDYLHNCLLWLDTRSEELARKLMDGFPKIRGYGLLPLIRWLRLTNGAPNLSGRDPISKALWLIEHKPDSVVDLHKFFDVKDYLVSRLCDSNTTSFDIAQMMWVMDNRPGKWCWSDTLLEKAGLNRAVLPDVRNATDMAGVLTKTSAQELGLSPGTPVSVGTGDVVSTAIGAGTGNTGMTHLYLGSSSWSATFMKTRKVDISSGIATVCGAVKGDYLLVAPQESAGSCVDWCCRNLGLELGNGNDIKNFDALASSAKPGSGGLLFLPWMTGERVPIDDGHLRAAFLNLSHQHGRAEQARAILEGVAYNCRWALETLERISSADTSQAIRIVGGGSTSELWCQIMSNTLQRPVQRIKHGQFVGARGVAMIAAVAIGWFDSLDSANQMCVKGRLFEPDDGSAEMEYAGYRKFTEAYKQLRPLYNFIN